MKAIGYTLSGGKLSNDVSQNHRPSKFGVRVEGEGDLVYSWVGWTIAALL